MEKPTHPDDLGKGRKAWRAFIGERGAFLMELRLRGGDGGY